jgi:DMSO reductase family type II enzyme heme b subunit
VKRLLPALLFVPLAAAAADIAVQRLAGEPSLDPLSPAWLAQAPTIIKVYPQTGVPPAAAQAATGNVKLRAQAGATTLALHLEWPDRKPAARRGVNEFADAAAVQWPLQPESGLPHVGMGHRGAPVYLWFWRADGSVETLAAEGFGTLTRQPADGLQARGVWKNGVWRVVFVRATTAAASRLPLAIAIWNGEGAERNGLKRLSAWQTLRFDGAAEKVSLRDTAPSGSAVRGKRLMQAKGCAACHNFPGNPAKPAIGPDLSNVGGLHAADYLAESMREPSKIVVPGKGYFTEQDGRRVSIMPPFEGSEAERGDLLAFLLSLR